MAETKEPLRFTRVRMDFDDGYVLDLTPTLRAATAIAEEFGGLLPAIQRVSAIDPFALCVVVAAAADLKGEEREALPERLLVYGLGPAHQIALEYLGLLCRGGRPEAVEEGDATGNA